MTKQQLAQFSERLLDQQTELLGVADLIEEPMNAATLGQSMVGRLSLMDVMQQQSISSVKQDRQDESLLRIKAALIRIDEGQYGHCVGCLSLISLARLHVDPSVEHCVNCAN